MSDKQLTGKELFDIGFRIIMNNTILWAKWHSVKTQRERDYMILEALESTRWEHAYKNEKGP